MLILHLTFWEWYQSLSSWWITVIVTTSSGSSLDNVWKRNWVELLSCWFSCRTWTGSEWLNITSPWVCMFSWRPECRMPVWGPIYNDYMNPWNTEGAVPPSTSLCNPPFYILVGVCPENWPSFSLLPKLGPKPSEACIRHLFMYQTGCKDIGYICQHCLSGMLPN